VKSFLFLLFYLERFRTYGVLKNVELFGGHPVGLLIEGRRYRCNDVLTAHTRYNNDEPIRHKGSASTIQNIRYIHV